MYQHNLMVRVKALISSKGTSKRKGVQRYERPLSCWSHIVRCFRHLRGSKKRSISHQKAIQLAKAQQVPEVQRAPAL